MSVKDLQNLITTERKLLQNLFYLCMHFYSLQEKNSAVLPCSLQSQYSDSAIPVLGRSMGERLVPGSCLLLPWLYRDVLLASFVPGKNIQNPKWWWFGTVYFLQNS